ncbi:MAG: universal stress protein [Bacteriovoracaceae bacterium]|nr:universal stress protein [Bacteriovoracaceae bacterium]
MFQMIYLAYDGSLHSDWVARYAMNMATNIGVKELHILYVEDGKMSRSKFDEKLKALVDEVEQRNLEPFVSILPLKGNVSSSIINHLPQNSQCFLIAGARSHGHLKGFLSGSIAEKLLIKNKSFSTIIFRVTRPGLLGVAKNILIPTAKNHLHLQQASSILKGFAPGISELRLLHIKKLFSLFFRNLSPKRAERFRKKSLQDLEEVSSFMKASLDLGDHQIKTHAQLSNSLSKEVILFANKWHSDLIFMGAPDSYLNRHSFFGNLFEQILRRSNCDVALYHTSDK